MQEPAKNRIVMCHAAGPRVILLFVLLLMSVSVLLNIFQSTVILTAAVQQGFERALEEVAATV